MHNLWVIANDGEPIYLAVDGNDTLILRHNGKTIARYNEKLEQWLGLVNGKLIRVQWTNIKNIAEMFLN